MNKIGNNVEVTDESEAAQFGLTTQELRNRLKHVAGLCYALCCDIGNAEIEADYLREENEYLRRKLEEAGIKVRKPPKTVQGVLNRRRKYEKQISAALGENTHDG